MEETYTPEQAKAFNQRWFQNFDSAAGMEKNAAKSNQWITDRLDEGCFWDRLFPPVGLQPTECDRSPNGKTPVKIEDIRAGQWAVPVDYSGNTMIEPRLGERYVLTFQKIQTATVVYLMEELWTEKRPVLEHIKEDMGTAISDAVDRSGIINVESAVWYLFNEQYANTAFCTSALVAKSITEVSVFKSATAWDVTDGEGNPADNYDVQAIRKEDATKVLRAFNGRAGEQMKADKLLVSDYDLLGATDWDLAEVGDAKVSRSVETAELYSKMKGITVIRTSKQRWLRPGNLYAFAPMDMLGSHYRVGGVESFQQKRGTRVEQFSWVFRAFGIGNISGIRKVEFYSASANPNAAYTGGGYTLVQPVVEDHVIKNHRADEDAWFPTVQMY